MDDESHTENQEQPNQVSSLMKQLKAKKGLQPSKSEPSFWDYFTGEEDFKTSNLPALRLDEILNITKSLSDERKKINQKLERINKEIDLLSIKIESLKLVGGNDEETFERISELTNQGEKLSQELEKLDSNLKMVRDHREQLLNNPS
jgi:seryl-tRNA synthetase